MVAKKSGIKKNKNSDSGPDSSEVPTNFIKQIIEEDIRKGKFDTGKNHIRTRFPPEPNGYLHIGHAKSICLNFGLAEEFNGTCNLRFDDTNPSAEEEEYVESIKEDIKWLGFDWEDRLYFASDYFDKLYEFAIQLIKKGKAYVCDLSMEEIKRTRGTLTEPGIESPYRNRSIEENLKLFEGMKNGEYPDGSRVLRAKIDMSSPNLNMRDPPLYRIKKVPHHRTGTKWVIYPMYDFAHGQSDYLEGITHSLCTLEFENHRPLYDWFLFELGLKKHPEDPPRQIEFARLNLTYTVLSKRKLLQLVNEGYVDGWDDPRMPTISGMRRRGYTPRAIRNFAEKIGVSKRNSIVDISLLEAEVRDDLNEICPRVMAVLDPLKVTIINYPAEKEEFLEAPNHPTKPEMGKRTIPFSKILYIEREDFMENPPKKYYRLAPGREVRLRYGYFIKCEEVVKNDNGEIIELKCSYDPATKGGYAPDGRKVKATLHWVSAKHAIECTARLYDRLFNKANPLDTSDGTDFKEHINKNSLEIRKCYVEPTLKDAKPEERFQFERLGYFIVDRKDSKPGKLVFNRIITIKDTWAKIKSKMKN